MLTRLLRVRTTEDSAAMPIEVSPVGLEDLPYQPTGTGGAAGDETPGPTTDQGARTGVPDAGQTVLIEPIGSSLGGSATAGMASTTNPRDRHPDDDAGRDPIR